MSNFFSYIRDLFTALFRNLGDFFYTGIIKPWTFVGSDFSEYDAILRTYLDGFGIWGWMLFVLFLLIVVSIIGLLGYMLYLLIYRVVRIGRNDMTRSKMLAQIQSLNDQLYAAVMEKNEILKLKVGSLGINPNSSSLNPDGTSRDEENKVNDSMFPKLAMIDKKYQDYHPRVDSPDMDANISLEELSARFRLFAASQLGLYYETSMIRTVFAALGTSRLLILEGISGTGKTSLPYALGKFFQNDVQICSVQPSWRDRSELIGYYNEFTKKFNETDFLKAVYEATYREDNCIIILDEMNLARVEYYFAEFLSIMEMPDPSEWKVEVTNTPSADNPRHLENGKLLIPQNLWFFGTANNDDSTFTITDKVYDRAMSLQLNNKGVAFDAEFTEPVAITYNYLAQLYNEAQTNYPVSEVNLGRFAKLDTFVIAKFHIAFGNRIMKQLKRFVPNYVACGGTELEALDFIFSSKVLKKFSALNLAFLHEELKQLATELEKLFGKNTFKLSNQVIDDFIKMS
ncbi:MAG: hypothetical protein LKE36_03550 [Bacilli bacterium]|jgi:hypothetical protein|nr:hypothetical protein [Bacilli bacterium]